MKKPSLPKDKIREQAVAASQVKVTPTDRRIFDLVSAEAARDIHTKNPYVVLKYFQDAWQCFSDWEKDELKQFTGFLSYFAGHTWQQVYATSGKSNKHGLAYTPYDLSTVPKAVKGHLEKVRGMISEDISFFELRVNQKKLRVHGFQAQSAFFLVLLDREHSVFPS